VLPMQTFGMFDPST